MSHFTEKARKLAGISEMAPGGYPKDSRQRGCSFWAKFVVAADAIYEESREERDRLISEKERESQERVRLIRENAKLKHDLAALKVEKASQTIREEIPDFTPGHVSRLVDATKA